MGCSARDRQVQGPVWMRSPALPAALLDSGHETYCHFKFEMLFYIPRYGTTIMCFLLENGDAKDMYLITAYCLVMGFFYMFGYYWRQCEESGQVTSAVSGFCLA